MKRAFVILCIILAVMLVVGNRQTVSAASVPSLLTAIVSSTDNARPMCDDGGSESTRALGCCFALCGVSATMLPSQTVALCISGTQLAPVVPQELTGTSLAPEPFPPKSAT